MTQLQLDIRDARLTNVFADGAELETVTTGYEFLEGPIWHPTEKHLIFSDIMGNTIYRWQEALGPFKLRMNSHLANGNTYDRQGRMLTCEHASSCVSRTTFYADGSETYEVLATHHEGKQLNSPNDIVVKVGRQPSRCNV